MGPALANCYEGLNRNFNIVLNNTVKWFQASQLVLQHIFRINLMTATDWPKHVVFYL
jgi:hypothetical protein